MSSRRRLVGWLALGVVAVAAVYVVVAFVVDWPDWAEPVARYIVTVGLPGDPARVRGRGRRQLPDRDHARDAADDQLRALARR